MFTKQRDSIDDVTPEEWNEASRAERMKQQTTDSKPNDPVERPAHYTQDDGMQCIDAIKAQLSHEEFIGYLRGTIAKYNWRIMHKHPEPLQDAQKIRWFADYLEKYLLERASKNAK